MKCPRCGSKETARILYGMPASSEELEIKLQSKKLYLGGCCVTGQDPKYHCFGCNRDFGTPPFFDGKNGTEDYRKAVLGLSFGVGGFFQGVKRVLIDAADDRIVLRVELPFNEVFLCRKMEPEEWAGLLERLYCKLYIHEWKKRFDSEHVCDGEQWSLELKLSGGRVRNYYGNNEYPPYWKELLKTFEPFFKEAALQSL